jgi:hypothetical protein
MMLTLSSPSRASLLAAAILIACSSHAFCQAGPLDYVPNRPYTAQVIERDVQTRANGAQVQRKTKIFEARDSQGRRWIESFQSDNMDRPMMVTLYIPLRRQFIQLFPGQRTARVMTFPGTGPIPIHQNLHVLRTTTESLPGQTMQGIYAEGTRTTQVMPPGADHGPNVVDVRETWISPDLKIVVFSKDTSTDPDSEQITTEIRQLDRSEPNPALFEIPADYKIVEAPIGPR